jgi:NADH:ubiquinone oxidoreductase subunit 6 (subunit J)
MINLVDIDWGAFFFVLFALLACGFAVAVLFTANIVRMAFYLTLSLGATAGLFFLAGAEFVGAMQLMIYVGGTLVLLIFGVMLTAQARFISLKTSGGEWVLAVILGSGLLLLLMQTALAVRDWRTPHPYPRLASAAARLEDAAETLKTISQEAVDATGQSSGLRPGRVNRIVRQQARLVPALEASRGPAAELAPKAIEPLDRSVALVEQLSGSLETLRGDGKNADGLRKLAIDASDAATQLDAAAQRIRQVARPLKVSPAESKTATQIGLAFAGPRVDKLDQPDQVLRQGMSGYLLPFVIVSVHLLVVLVGAAYMARPKRRATSATGS